MAGPPSPSPVRFPSGCTTDFPFGPLGNYGFRNPFFYHEVEDDFDFKIASDGFWTISNQTTGTIADTPGDGGLLLFTTAAANGDTEALQPGKLAFNLNAPGKKLFYFTRFQLSDVVASAFVAGITNTLTTITPTDGIFFSKASGSGQINLISAVASVLTTLAIPLAAYNLVNATFIDLGWFLDRNQNLYAFVGNPNLVGYLPQSGTGPVNAVGVTLSPVPGPAAALQQSVTPFTVSSANVGPTLVLQAGAAAVKTMTADFVMAAKER